ncbi:hypothetical protein P7H16_03805 [Paenibacillus larvae]|nr:hypothetical protein [Paenibacillus larvae]MDT2246288.1 hypothetical protein [Paenibacillus larvae]MDT2256968.1 hypothetical protein [Paenibacillus larvae]MDT2259345.1 hypothetical protein [Paenibacillus larvae]MDT2286269.1 hypothetical protein [Paenibacillus larvae]MDT2303909.1 hypothetical protein [Paenibacillus larvae]
MNDLAAVLQFCSIVYVAFYTGGGYISGWGTVHELFMISLLYFIGTIFYVKTMIREKITKHFIGCQLPIILPPLWSSSRGSRNG